MQTPSRCHTPPATAVSQACVARHTPAPHPTGAFYPYQQFPPFTYPPVLPTGRQFRLQTCVFTCDVSDASSSSRRPKPRNCRVNRPEDNGAHFKDTGIRPNAPLTPIPSTASTLHSNLPAIFSRVPPFADPRHLCPQVTELNLDNCRSTNIVGLTEDFANLTKLSLINVGLTSLKGFPKLPKLKKLELSDNRISSGLGSLSEACASITNLNLSGNRLKDLDALKPLEGLESLEVLDLFNNEATSVDNYREKLFAMIPSLKYLDG